MKYITVSEASEKWNIGARRICILCKEGRVPGAVKKSRIWMIPEHATKPEDGRKAEIVSGISPEYLILNPSFFEKRFFTPSPEEKQICAIWEQFMKGQLQEAFYEANKLATSLPTKRYQFTVGVLLLLLSGDLGNKKAYQDSFGMLKQLALDQDANYVTRNLCLFYMGELEEIDIGALQEDVYDERMPLISLILFKKTINDAIRQQNKVSIPLLEMLCREMEHKDSPLITVYCHIYLAIYHHLMGSEDGFKQHYDKALDICLFRKWYTPLAEYSVAVDLNYIRERDEEAYFAIKKLSDSILDAYVKVGVFDEIVGYQEQKRDVSIRIGYKLLQGKTIEQIAGEMNMSQYKVKQHIEDMCAAIGVRSKKEMKEFLFRNLYI